MAEVKKSESEITETKAIQGKSVLIIEGIRENGSKFRPADWPERISSMYAEFGKDRRLHYAPGVSPRMLNGQKVLAIEPSLRERNPAVFQAIMKFVRENNLRTREEANTAE
ncbi:MAG: DUF3579 domain-containing protein [Gammaproteobacteria bacterium]|nr:DUF3579 domain-containing protein [Gammaproteobacteria bacterium]